MAALVFLPIATAMGCKTRLALHPICIPAHPRKYFSSLLIRRSSTRKIGV